MSLLHSPRIVTNGLVLCLDTGNKKSYPGSGTSIFDISGNQNHGVLTNGPTFSNENGGVLTFDGSNDFIEISPVPLLNNVSQFSYSSFINFNTKTTGNAFFSYGPVSIFTTDILFAWETSSSAFIFQINNGSDASAKYGYNTLNTWINLSIVYNGSLSGNSNRLKAYINGNEIVLDFASYTVPAVTASPSNPLCRLGTYGSDTSNVWAMNGKIANTLLYNRALSRQEILQNYNATRGRFGI